MSRYSDDQISKAMKQDCLHEAEQITGQSYREAGTGLLGLGLLMKKNEAVSTMLERSGDVHYGLTVEEYERRIGAMGWERVLCLPFNDDPKFGDKENSLRVFWNDRIGSLLHFDTFGGNKSVNGGKWHYCWKPNDGEEGWKHVSSGHFTESVSAFATPH
jgi:hypothetical protein